MGILQQTGAAAKAGEPADQNEGREMYDLAKNKVGGLVNRRELLWTTIAASGACGALLQAQDKNLDPLKVTPQTHKLLFENQFVRVIESNVQAGATEPKHEHPHSVTAYLADLDAELKPFPNGKTSRVHRTAGTAGWSEAIVHEIKNVGATSSHTIRIELKC